MQSNLCLSFLIEFQISRNIASVQSRTLHLFIVASYNRIRQCYERASGVFSTITIAAHTMTFIAVKLIRNQYFVWIRYCDEIVKQMTCLFM